MVNLLVIIIVAIAFLSSYKMFKEDPQLLKRVYLNNIIEYPIAVGIVIIMFTTVGLIFVGGFPSILKFSWLQLIGTSGNLLLAPFTYNNRYLSIFFWAAIVLCLPYMAKVEEEIFRSDIFRRKDRIKSSLKFGAIHMIIGVPIIGILLISVVGYILSSIYVTKYVNIVRRVGHISADEISTEASTSFHAKYNFILVTIILILVLSM